MRKVSVDIIMGCQWGSESKGLFAAHLGRANHYDWLVSCATRNAGHTVFTAAGTRLVARYLPTACVTNPAPIFIAAGTQLHRDTLEAEIEQFEAAGVSIRQRLQISSSAGLLSHEHEEMERSRRMDVRIGSTCEGVGEALIDRVSRTAPLFADMYDGYYFAPDLALWGQVLLECSQGYLLSNLSRFYPYVTSRTCSAAAYMSYAKLPPRAVRDVYGIFRTWPIRVANRTEKPLDRGYGWDPGSSSGPMNGREVGWEDVRKAAGATVEQIPVEITTVTKLPRRIAAWDSLDARDAIDENGVNRPCLSFLNYLDASCRDAGSWLDLPSEVRDWVCGREDEMGQRFALLSTGPQVVFSR